MRQIRSASENDNKSQEALLIPEAFDYAPLDADTAWQVRTAAHRIREQVKRTLEVLIAIGNDLIAVKQALPYGRFGPWLRAEFGWMERTARNFMTVAGRFGARTEIISELHIDPTAAYLLAAPSAPETASKVAIERAEGGERITVSVAKDILRSLRKQSTRCQPNSPEGLPTPKLLGQLLESLEFFRRHWDPRQVAVLARQLRDFADSLEEKQRFARGTA